MAQKANKRLLTASVALFIFFLSLLGPAWGQSHAEGIWGAKGDVSLIALIGQPEKYNGSKVKTAGVAVIQFEQYMLYLGPYDADEGIEYNGVWLALDHDQISKWKSLNRHLVEVEGVFELPLKGSYGMCPNGAITKITSMRQMTLQ